MHYFFKWLILLLMMLFLSDNALAVYWIDEMDKEPDNYLLIKADKTKVPVAIYKVLKNGDCITVTGTEARLWIVSDSGSREMLSHDGVSTKCIKGENPVSIRSSRLAEWAGRWLTLRLTYAPTSRTLPSPNTRGDKVRGVTIPLAKQGGLRMVSGKRPLYIGWQGGKHPFSVRLMLEDSKRTIFERRNITDRRIKVVPLLWTEGIYCIEIGDADGVISHKLYVVSPKQIPYPMLELHGSKSLQDRQTSIVQAVKLASQPDGWAFEAYQTAAILAPRYQAAQILQENLEHGVMPPEGPE